MAPRILTGPMARLFDPRRKARPADSVSDPSAAGFSAASASVPLGGTRGQTAQRLQVGLAGLAGTLLLIGLVDLIESRAAETERTAAPEAASTNQPAATPTRSDPLVDAGVVPDLPASPTPQPAPDGEAPILPERGRSDDLAPQ